MISQNQIVRMIDAQAFRQLAERVLANGRCRSELVSGLLRRSDVAAPAALGLALQRLAELTYRPSAASNQIVSRLVELQRDDGLFGESGRADEASIAASAAALRGLITWTQQNERQAVAIVCKPVARAIGRGLRALANLWGQHRPLIHDEAIGWAIVLWQLGDVPEFRTLIPPDDLLGLVREAGGDLIEDELCRYARAMAA